MHKVSEQTLTHKIIAIHTYSHVLKNNILRNNSTENIVIIEDNFLNVKTRFK